MVSAAEDLPVAREIGLAEEGEGAEGTHKALVRSVPDKVLVLQARLIQCHLLTTGLSGESLERSKRGKTMMSEGREKGGRIKGKEEK